jgi:hypothetical protein
MASVRSSLRPRALALAGALLAMLVGAAANAETYKLTDEKGRVQYTDRVPPDAVNRGVVELNKQGMTKHVTAPALTPEQRRNEEEKAERQRQAERAAMRQRSLENALLSSYSSESDIDVAKRRNLALIGAAILSAEARIKALEKRSATLEKERQFYDKKPVPEKLRRELASVTTEIPKQHELILEKKQEALAVETKYREQKERYRDLKAQIEREKATPRLQ